MSGSLIERIETIVPATIGGETYVAHLRGNEYIARYRRIAGFSQEAISVYAWSTHEAYGLNLHAVCRQYAAKLHIGSYTLRLVNGDMNTFSSSMLMDPEVVTSSKPLLAVTHELPRHTIMWKHADMGHDNTYEHRPNAAIEHTNEMMYQHAYQEGGYDVPPERLMARTGSFTVRRSLQEALRLFVDLDNTAP